MIVVDASVVATALTDDDADGDRARAHLRGQRLAAPHLLDLEVTSVWRRLEATGRLDRRRAERALHDLLALGIERVTHTRLLDRCWELRNNLTVYDAAYVALAEALDAPLVTADRRLAGAPGIRCTIDFLDA